MFFGIVALIVGGILILIALGHLDEERRQRGRGRTNRILTDFGGGSFGEGVSAMFGEWTHGCLSKVFGILGIACVIFAFKSCSSNNNSPDSVPAPVAKKEYKGREYIRERITGWGSCRLVAITKNGGNVAVAGENSCAVCGAYPNKLWDALKEISDEGHRITDVCLTEKGKWVVIFGRNGIRKNGIPDAMYDALVEFHDNGEEIYCASLNDVGDWVVISDKHYKTSSVKLVDWLSNVQRKYGYGKLFYVSLTDDAKIAVFDGGYSYVGNYPKDMREAIKRSDFNPKVVKMAGDSWFFADETGKAYRYWM